MTETTTLKHLISIADLKRECIDAILAKATELKQTPTPCALDGKIIASCFFEASTRTRLSFEAAAYRLGANVVGFADSGNTSLGQKGESLTDTVRVIESYADLLVIRHPLEGAARLAARNVNIPVINAGDGSNQHPSQTLLDLYTMQDCHGHLDELKIAFIGDLKYGRTVHSLVEAAAHYKQRLYFIAPDFLSLPDRLCDHLRTHKIKYTFHRSIDEIIDKVDILYMTRLQTERFHPNEHKLIADQCKLHGSQLARAKPGLKVLHPLPRVDEIDPAIDTTAHAHYFQQAANGLLVRQALLSMLLEA